MSKYGKQAKILSQNVQRQVLDYCEHTRYPIRNKVMFLLSVKAALRAIEISQLRWRMVLNADRRVGDELHLEDIATKGKKSGRTIPLNFELKAALEELYKQLYPEPDEFVIYSDRGRGLTRQAVVDWFWDTYKALRLQGCSSHSGRRTFITNVAKKSVEAGITYRDIQEMFGHADLSTTQRYIQGSTEGKKTVVQKI